MKDVCPCYGCKDRIAEPNCHDTCYDRYIPWCERQDEKRKRANIARNEENTVIRHIVNSINRNKKQRHKR